MQYNDAGRLPTNTERDRAVTAINLDALEAEMTDAKTAKLSCAHCGRELGDHTPEAIDVCLLTLGGKS